MQPPPTRFATVDGDRVAYQEFGVGTAPLLGMRGRLVSIETVWEHPAHLRLWRAIGDRMRGVLFDFRGSGLSDMLPDELIGDMDLAVADALAVLDEVGIDRANVSAEFDSAAVAINLAVRHPERVEKLVLVNGFAKGCAGDGYDMGFPADVLEQLARDAANTWGSGELIALMAPNIAADPTFAARIERVGARPRAAATIIRRNGEIDVRDQLPRITVPTLVVYTGDVVAATPEQSRHLADHIPEARLFEGQSSTFYWGGGAIEAILDFLVEPGGVTTDHDLVTLLMTDVVASTDGVVAAGDRAWRQTLDFLDDVTSSRVTRHGGRVVHHTGDGHLVEFSRPRDAVEAALALLGEAHVLGVRLRAGLHTGEVERRESGDIGGLTVHIAARVTDLAEADEVVASRTVIDLLGATRHAVTPRGSHTLKGVPGDWTLFTIA